MAITPEVERDARREMSCEATLRVSVLQLPEAIRDWDLVTAFLKLRKIVFIDEMGWPLVHVEGIEFEQYDTLDAIYVIAHRGRKVCGGARLRRTDLVHGTGRTRYSYMIRDACRGLLPGMPSDLCRDTPPVDAGTWELTRLATIRDPDAAEAILMAANRYLFANEARQCLFLGPPAFLRMARRLGWRPSPMGPIRGNRDGRFLAFSCPVHRPA